jgi:hypothetical protein
MHALLYSLLGLAPLVSRPLISQQTSTLVASRRHLFGAAALAATVCLQHPFAAQASGKALSILAHDRPTHMRAPCSRCVYLTSAAPWHDHISSGAGGGLIEAAISADPLSTRLRQAREGIAQISSKAQLGEWDEVRQAVSFTLPFLSLKGALSPTGGNQSQSPLCVRHMLPCEQ